MEPTVTVLKGGEPSDFNNGAPKAGHAMVSHGHNETKFTTIIGDDNFRRKLRDSMIELASSELGHPLSTEAINHIETRLPQIFYSLQTPDHPPYSAMIYRAIEVLVEGGSSSRECISAYIKCHYQDLPWAHDGILSYHLSKLEERRELVKNPSNGFYSFPKNMEDTKLFLEYPCFGMDMSDPGANSLAIEAKDDAEPNRGARSGRRGRPPKQKPGHNKVVNLETGQRHGKTKQVAGEQSQGKRRGRPPKKQRYTTSSIL